MRLEYSIFNKTKKNIKNLSKKDKKIITILGLIAIITASVLIVRLYFFYTKINFKYSGVFNEGLIEQPVNINPLTPENDSDRSISKLIYSGLLKQNQKLEYEPELIKNIPPSTDNNSVKVCLKENIYWHDGEKLSVDNIIFTFSKAKNIQNINPKYSLINFINISKADNNCINIESQLDQNQIYHLLTLGIIPKHIWENFNIEEHNSDFNIKPVGTGFFKFQSLGKDKEGTIKFYKLTENEKYYKKQPYIKNITFKFFPSTENAHIALQEKQINALSTDIDSIEVNQDLIKKYQFNWDFYNALFFNLNNDLLKNQSIREALTYLTPKEKILKEDLNYAGKIINGPVLNSSYFYNPNIPKIKYNQEKAINILKQNGWNKNQDGLWQKNDQIIEFNIKTINKTEMVKTAKAVQKAWQNIGLKVKLITIPSDRMSQIIKEKDFDMLLYGVLSAKDTGLFSMWHSSSSEIPTLNITNLTNRNIDGLLEKAIITNNLIEKKGYYNEFQIALSNLYPAIFLYNSHYNYLVDKDIKGINIKKINQVEDRFIGIENWYNKKIRVWK